MAPIQPDLASRPFRMSTERMMAAEPHVLFQAWTVQIARWFAAPGTVLMVAQVNRPYFFEARFNGERHPHYGRFLRLEPGRIVEMTWLTASGTLGFETVLTIALTPAGRETHLRLTHAGFPDDESRRRHAEAWPSALDHLARVLDSWPLEP